MFLGFMTANVHEGDDGKEYSPRGKIMISTNHILAYYDHTIVLPSEHKVRVMETAEEIRERLKWAGINETLKEG